MTNINVPILPIAPVERIVRKAGADRVSEDAGIELARALEEYGLELSREAISLAKHAKRATVKEEDIRLAYERSRKGVEIGGLIEDNNTFEFLSVEDLANKD